MATVTAKKVILKDQDGNTLIPFVEGMGVHEIGEVFHAPYTEKYTPKGAVPANGKEYRAGGYNDFWNNFVITGLVATCTYEEFDRQVRENGFCDVYAINTSTRTFKVPQIPDGLTLNVEEIAGVRGNGKALGLTNGEYDLGLTSANGVYMNVFGGKPDAVNHPIGTGAGENGIRGGSFYGIITDSRKSGVLAEVDVINARKQKWFCQLASGEINKADLDLNGLRADIANSANTNADNFTKAGKVLLTRLSLSTTTGSEIARDFASGYQTSQPKSGVYFFGISGKNGSGYFRLQANFSEAHYISSTYRYWMYMEVSAGIPITCTYKNGQNPVLNFAPLKGEE